MTIQLNIGLQPLQPALPRRASWVTGPCDDKASNLRELGELNSLNLQYISLRDLMEVSPTTARSAKAKELEWYGLSEVKFKDELLEQAARAYLQPTGKKATPEAHFLEQHWKNFTAKNQSLFASATEYIVSQAEACIKYFKAQVLCLMQHLKPHYCDFLRMRSRDSA